MRRVYGVRNLKNKCPWPLYLDDLMSLVCAFCRVQLENAPRHSVRNILQYSAGLSAQSTKRFGTFTGLMN